MLGGRGTIQKMTQGWCVGLRLVVGNEAGLHRREQWLMPFVTTGNTMAACKIIGEGPDRNPEPKTQARRQRHERQGGTRMSLTAEAVLAVDSHRSAKSPATNRVGG
jgi:hypothetical protein